MKRGGPGAHLGVEESTDRLVVAEFKFGMTAVGNLLDVLGMAAPQYTVTPRGSATLFTEKCQAIICSALQFMINFIRYYIYLYLSLCFMTFIRSVLSCVLRIIKSFLFFFQESYQIIR